MASYRSLNSTVLARYLLGSWHTVNCRDLRLDNYRSIWKSIDSKTRIYISARLPEAPLPLNGTPTKTQRMITYTVWLRVIRRGAKVRSAQVEPVDKGQIRSSQSTLASIHTLCARKAYSATELLSKTWSGKTALVHLDVESDRVHEDAL
jgi:hypothetical protein